MADAKTFGETIKALREARNLTLQELSSSLGIGLSMLSKVENNSRRPTKDVIERMSKFFHVEKQQLYIAFYSDEVVDQLRKQKTLAKDILKAATKKIELAETA